MSIKSKLVLAVATTAIGAMLVGTGTSALFTSEAANTGNSFVAGTVAISLDKEDGNKYFNISNMVPGDSGDSLVKVQNNGTMELRYDIEETLTGDLSLGANPLKVTIVDEANGNLIIPGPDSNRVLAPGASEYLRVKYSLPLEAGNEYQGKSALLGIKVIAEQTKNNPVQPK